MGIILGDPMFWWAFSPGTMADLIGRIGEGSPVEIEGGQGERQGNTSEAFAIKNTFSPRVRTLSERNSKILCLVGEEEGNFSPLQPFSSLPVSSKEINGKCNQHRPELQGYRLETLKSSK